MSKELQQRITARSVGPVRVETRADGKRVIAGYGAVFYRQEDPGTEYWLYDDLVERIDPAAFDRAIKEKHDARGLFNHDSNNLLGRVSNGTMRLSVDKQGLLYEIDAPKTQIGQDVLEMIDRGDLTGSSFAFYIRGQRWEDVRDEKDQVVTVRTITDLDLVDTGPVTFPAYEATTAGARSFALRSADAGDEARHQRDAWRRCQRLLRIDKGFRLAQVTAAETPCRCRRPA
jgi:HK97 family phage prohead protease